MVLFDQAHACMHRALELDHSGNYQEAQQCYEQSLQLFRLAYIDEIRDDCWSVALARRLEVYRERLTALTAYLGRKGKGKGKSKSSSSRQDFLSAKSSISSFASFNSTTSQPLPHPDEGSHSQFGWH